MNNIIGLRVRSERHFFNYFNSNIAELIIDYKISESEVIQSYTIGINNNGKIIRSDSLVSRRDSFEYYIEIGEILKQIQKIELKGKFIYDSFMKLEEESEEKMNKFKSKNTDYACISIFPLEKEIVKMETTYKRLRREDKKKELLNQIEVKKIELSNRIKDNQNKRDKYEREFFGIREHIVDSANQLLKEISQELWETKEN